MAIGQLRLLLLTLIGFFAARAAGNTWVPALIPESGGTNQLYPIVAQGHGKLKWSHGAFLFNDSPSSDFYTLNNEGDVIAKVHFQAPDDLQYRVADFDRWRDGSIVAAMVPDVTNDASPFLAFIAPDGRIKHLIRTAPYYPHLLTIAQDGTVWTLGVEMIQRRLRDPDLDPKDGVLRQFDRGGAIMASALPQGDFLSRGDAWRLGLGKLSAVRDRLAWYSSMDGAKSQYVEISTDKIEQHIFPGVSRDLMDERILGLAVTDAGDVTVTTQDTKSRHTFLLDRLRGKWVRLGVPAFPNGFGVEPSVVGSDGNSLVFWYRSSSAFYGLERPETVAETEMLMAPDKWIRMIAAGRLPDVNLTYF